jgi:hypothetical protein
MRFRLVGGAVAALAAIAIVLAFVPACGSEEEMEKTMPIPFGGEEDVAFASAAWEAMSGYQAWAITSDAYKSAAPHGMFVKIYYNVVNVDGKPYHVIVKDNFGGEEATLEMVEKMPADHLMAVTVMVQREAGYDPDNKDWFWVKYAPDGTVDKNPQGMALAGRVAKGMKAGCIACHAKAADGDYIFINDAPASE